MILVTGGTGFVGGHLVDRLLSLGRPFRCLVRPSSAHRIPAGVETAPADFLTGRGIAPALDGVDTVIHLAGVTKALRPADYYEGNVRASENLALAIASRRDIRLVHVSSLAAIGPSLDGRPLDEDAPPHPVSTYGKSKLEAERIVRQLLPGAVVVRPPAVYGPRDTDIFQLLKSIAQGVVLEIAGGERWFSAIYVEDLVEGLLAAADSPVAAGRAYFLSHAKTATWQELGATAAHIMNRQPRTLRIPMPAAKAVGFFAEMWSRITRNPAIISREKVSEACYRYWTCDPVRAAEDLHFVAPTPLASGLAKTLAWYKEAGWLKF